MRQKPKIKQGIADTQVFYKFLFDQFYKSRTNYKSKAGDKWDEVLTAAKLFYKNPALAVKALRKGSALYRETPVETYALCAFIYQELEFRKKKKQIIKKDPNYISLNRIVDDRLHDLCACINVDPNKVIPSKRNQRLHPKTAGKKWPGQTMARQPIIDRCIERYRRLAIKDKKKFLAWYKKQTFHNFWNKNKF